MIELEIFIVSLEVLWGFQADFDDNYKIFVHFKPISVELEPFVLEFVYFIVTYFSPLTFNLLSNNSEKKNFAFASN